MTNGRHLGLDLLPCWWPAINVSPDSSAPNKFVNNESAFCEKTLPTKINSYSMLFLPSEVVLDKI